MKQGYTTQMIHKSEVRQAYAWLIEMAQIPKKRGTPDIIATYYTTIKALAMA